MYNSFETKVIPKKKLVFGVRLETCVYNVQKKGIEIGHLTIRISSSKLRLRIKTDQRWRNILSVV